MVEAVRERTPPRPAPIPGATFWSLVLYHALVLVGGALVVLGALGKGLAWIAIGTPLFVAGVALQLAIVRWSVRKARWAAANRAVLRPGPRSTPRSTYRLCPACGWTGERPGPLCQRCSRVTVPWTRGAVPPEPSGF